MNRKILTLFGFLTLTIAMFFISANVSAADRFDVTDISYSYVSNNYPYYPNAQYYNSYDYYYTFPTYQNYGYVNPYSGYVSYPSYVVPYYSTYYPSSYYYSPYNNTISYNSPYARVAFSWQ